MSEGHVHGESEAISCLSHSEVSSENGVAEGNVDSSVVDMLHQKYLKSSLYQSTKEALGNMELGRGRKQKASKQGHEITYANGFLTQLYWVSKRSLKNLIRNPQASVAQVGNNCLRLPLLSVTKSAICKVHFCFERQLGKQESPVLLPWKWSEMSSYLCCL